MKMNFKNLLLLGLMTLAAGAFTACSDSSSDSDSPTPSPTPVNPDTPYTPSTDMVSKALQGIVRDTDGNPIQGVTITSGTSMATTNAVGLFTFKSVKAIDGRVIATFTKDGYFSVTRACDANNGLTWEVALVKKGSGSISDTKTFGAGTGSTLSTSGGMKVNLTGGSFKDEATGTDYTGTVQADMAYLDPDATNFADMMPGGDLIAAGDDPMLKSYGMVAVNLTDGGGTKLNLKDGAKATVTFPVPASFAGTDLPAEIPLWSFNEQTGKWEKDGVAKLSDDKTCYVGQVSHFSWWNLDYPYKQGIVSGFVKDEAGNPVASLPVHVGQLVKYTDKDGFWRTSVPADEEFEVYVELADYADGQTGKFGKGVDDPIVLKMNKEEEKNDVNITLGKLSAIRGTVRNADGTIPVAAFYLEYGGKKTRTFISSDGTFKVYAPVGYTGTMTLVATSASGSKKEVSIDYNGTEKSGIAVTFDGPTTKGALLISFLASDEVYTIDLTKGTGSINPHGVYVSKDATEADKTSFYLSQYVDIWSGTSNFNVNMSVNGAAMNTYAPNVSVFSYDENNITFQISGEGYRYGKREDGQIDYGKQERFIYESTEITVPVTEYVVMLYNVMPRSIGFPSFTPQLDTPAPGVQYYMKSSIGKGGMICYNGGEAEYNTLKAQADASGIPLYEKLCGEADVQSWGHTAGKEPTMAKLYYRCYYQDKKIILIAYNGAAEPIDFSVEGSYWFAIEEGQSPLIVLTFDNFGNDPEDVAAMARLQIPYGDDDRDGRK